MILTAVRHGDWAKAVAMLDYIVRLDHLTFFSVVKACGRAGRPEKALELLNSMDRWGLAQNAISRQLVRRHANQLTMEQLGGIHGVSEK